MRIQLLSDLHLESEAFEPTPTPGAGLLVLAGDIDAGWAGYRRFAGWPVPVLAVAGNHEFDRRDLGDAWPALRAELAASGIRLLECESLVVTGDDGRRIRFLGAVRWSDFDLFGAVGQAKAMRAGAYFQRVMAATRQGSPFDVAAMREASLACRRWLADALARSSGPGDDGWDATVVVTHFAPSLRSADPRFGRQAATASFCNADDDLIGLADLWLHGHLHCRHDYLVERPGRVASRVVSQARGLARRGETDGFDPSRLFEV
jgi:hypothetical protein